MKILIIVDKEGSAIDRLCEPVVAFNPHIKIRKIAVHPKKYSPDDLNRVRELAKWADLIDFAYWKTAVALLKEIPELEDKPRILGHFNEHSLAEQEWTGYRRIYVCNKWQAVQLQDYNPKLIPLSVDLDLYKYQEYLGRDRKVPRIGYVGRIGSWKGVYETMLACKELGYEFHIAGNVASLDYWNQIRAEADNGLLKFIPDLADPFMPEFYSNLTAYVCNSEDGTESGTMPILEAMACGIPVLTREIGVVRELGEHKKNMYIRKGSKEDVADLVASLKELVEDEELRMKLREAGRKAVHRRSHWNRARTFDRFYHDVVYGNMPMASIVIPTFNRSATLAKSLECAIRSSYPNKEIIVADDGSTDDTYSVVEKIRHDTDVPIKYVNTGMSNVYGLAQARNLGVLEAVGDVIIFVDDRLGLDEDAVKRMMEKIAGQENLCLFGQKDDSPRYVENFSAIHRKTLIRIGLFNTLIQKYGAMTEDFKTRLQMHGVRVTPIITARAVELMKSGSRWHKKDEIAEAKFIMQKLYE